MGVISANPMSVAVRLCLCNPTALCWPELEGREGVPFLDGRVLVMSAASAGRGDASDRILLRSKVRHLLPTSHRLDQGSGTESRSCCSRFARTSSMWASAHD